MPSNTALAMSEASARVGDGACTIDSSIWVAVMAGRPRVMQRCEDPLLQMGQLLDGQLGTEVAARHHDRSRRLDDAVEVLDRGPGLDLGDHHRAARVGLDTDPADVVRGAHERQRHHVDAFLDERVEHAEVLAGR